MRLRRRLSAVVVVGGKDASTRLALKLISPATRDCSASTPNQPENGFLHWQGVV